jgi:hypothetical protein
MLTLVAAIDNFSPNTEGGSQIMKTLRSAIVEINHANASDSPTNYAPLIEMLREDIPAVSMVSKESILYDGAVMRFIKNALNLSGHTVYKLRDNRT